MYFTEITDTISRLLLKEGVECFRYAEDEMRSDGEACLTGPDKSDFITWYRLIANNVSRSQARIILQFCEV